MRRSDHFVNHSKQRIVYISLRAVWHLVSLGFLNADKFPGLEAPALYFGYDLVTVAQEQHYIINKFYNNVIAHLSKK